MKARFTRGDVGDEVIRFDKFDAESFRDLYQRQTVRLRYGAQTEDGQKQGSWTDAMPGAKDRAPQVAAAISKRLKADEIDAELGFGNTTGIRLYKELIIDYDGEVGTLAVMRLPSYFTATLYFEDGRWSQIDKHVKTNSQTVFLDSDSDERFLEYVRFWLCTGYMIPYFEFVYEVLARGASEDEQRRPN